MTPPFTTSILLAEQITLEDINPSTIAPGLTSPSVIFFRFVPTIFFFAGAILFLMIIFGGFQMLSNPTNPQGQEAGKQRITYAVIGYLLLFSSYWLIQVLEVIFKLNIV